MNIQPPHLLADTRALPARMALAANTAFSGAVGSPGGDLEDSDNEQQQSQFSPSSQVSQSGGDSFTSGNHRSSSLEELAYLSRRKRLRSDDDDLDEEDDLEVNEHSGHLEEGALESGVASSEEEELAQVKQSRAALEKRRRNEAKGQRRLNMNGHVAHDDLNESSLERSSKQLHSHRKLGNGASRAREQAKDRMKRSTMDEVLKKLNKANHRHQSSLDFDAKSELHFKSEMHMEKLNGNSKASKMDFPGNFPFDLSALSSLAGAAVVGGEGRNVEDTEQQLTSLIDQLMQLRQKLVAQQTVSTACFCS